MLFLEDFCSRWGPAFWGIYSYLVCTNWSKKKKKPNRGRPEDTWSNLRVLSHWQFGSDPLLPSPGAAKETAPELLQPTLGGLYRRKKSMKLQITISVIVGIKWSQMCVKHLVTILLHNWYDYYHLQWQTSLTEWKQAFEFTLCKCSVDNVHGRIIVSFHSTVYLNTVYRCSPSKHAGHW